MAALPQPLLPHDPAPPRKEQQGAMKCPVFWTCWTNQLTDQLTGVVVAHLPKPPMDCKLARLRPWKTFHQRPEKERPRTKKTRAETRVGRETQLQTGSSIAKFEADSLKALRMGAASVHEQLPASVATRCSVKPLRPNAFNSSVMPRQPQRRMHRSLMVQTATAILSRPRWIKLNRSKQW